MDRRDSVEEEEGGEEVGQYLTPALSAKCHNNRTAEASQCPHACVVPGA